MVMTAVSHSSERMMVRKKKPITFVEKRFLGGATKPGLWWRSRSRSMVEEEKQLCGGGGEAEMGFVAKEEKVEK
ncbi:hypothetical protein VNO80_00966 [Phaseolus coccineus]|uniref:Uncharacterized protein n=1 Tax=Phaseolus coccineus TaxID=3886 RepID=A0AAN9P5R9_PHACN